MKLTRKCYGCKQEFRKSELIEYTGLMAQKGQWYCEKCLQEKLDREAFAMKVCQIFGLKSPGPVIWTQRKRLRDTYGYTDNLIIECLDYIYNVKYFRKLKESLGLITPKMVAEMKQYRSMEKARAGSITAAMAQQADLMERKYIESHEDERREEPINFDDFLQD